MDGQVILDRRREISRRETWLTGLVHQYPAMPRTEFTPGLPVIVDVAWTGRNSTVPRASTQGSEVVALLAGTRLTVATGEPEVADWSVGIPVTNAERVPLRVQAGQLRPEEPTKTDPAGAARDTNLPTPGPCPPSAEEAVLALGGP